MTKVTKTVLIIFSIFFLIVNAFAQQNDCLREGRKVPKYKVVNPEKYDKDGEITLRMDVSINPKHINREDMIELACKINRDFRNEERVFVTFFTSVRAAKTFNDNFHPHSKYYERNLNSLRGHYYLNRKTGEEYVSFAAFGKKPFDEERIDLKK